jgi:rare lipoprotein A (peptidoglycan hydrolase)
VNLDDIIRWLLTIIFTIIFILTPNQYLSEYQEPIGRYEPGPTAKPTPRPTSKPKKIVVFRKPVVRIPKHNNISGKASWHATGRSGRYAAACYTLRKAMGGGGKWRGQQVIVSRRGKVLIVTLNDWCGSKDKLIDLSDEAFTFFAPLSRGVIKVAVGW